MKMTRDKTAIFSIAVTQNHAAMDITGMVLWFHAASAAISFSFDKNSPASGITITDAVNGLATLQIDPADTAALSSTGTNNIPCELTLVDGANHYELDIGLLVVSANVGTP